MPAKEEFSNTEQIKSPGGQMFGIQGFVWGEPRFKGITFMLDGTCRVYDQHGRLIKGTIKDDKVTNFATCSHQQVIAAMKAEGVDWQTITHAGWPQLPYAELIKLKELPPTPLEELRKIKDDQLRRDALRARREYDKKLLDEAKLKEEE